MITSMGNYVYGQQVNCDPANGGNPYAPGCPGNTNWSCQGTSREHFVSARVSPC